jgi:gas vesicle protein
MAERTVSIVIDVSGADDAAREVRRVGSAFDDLLGGGLQTFARRGREVNATMKDLDGLLRRIVTGARTTGDVWKSVWREASDYFRRAVQEMAGAWNVNLGGLLPLLPGGLSGSNFGLGSAGAGLHGLGPLSGSTLFSGGALLGGLTVGSSNRLVSALGGLGSGALTGFGLGGPLGAVVGGIVGGIAGLFGSGSGNEKRHDAEIANQGFAQLARILEDYNRFRQDFSSSVNAAQQVWNQMQSQWVRPQSAPSQWPYFAAILRAMEQTEDERNRRRQLAAAGPVPEFAEGGLVGPQRTQRKSLAWVHDGEFVMNRQAVDRLGVSLLEGLNSGSGAGSSANGLSVSLEPASAQTLGAMLKQNPQALEEGLLVVLRRGGAASRALRG